MRILFTLLRNGLLIKQCIFFYVHTKNILFGKSVLFFWIDLTSVLSILQKLKVTNNWIKIYIYCEEYLFQLSC